MLPLPRLANGTIGRGEPTHELHMLGPDVSSKQGRALRLLAHNTHNATTAIVTPRTSWSAVSLLSGPTHALELSQTSQGNAGNSEQKAITQ